MKQLSAAQKQRQEINRLYAALKNFLTVGYSAEFQKHESAIEQLDKLRRYAREKQRTKQ